MPRRLSRALDCNGQARGRFHDDAFLLSLIDHAATAAEHECKHNTGNETANMRHVSHPALVSGLAGSRDRTDAAEGLKDNPKPKYDERWHSNDLVIDEDPH